MQANTETVSEKVRRSQKDSVRFALDVHAGLVARSAGTAAFGRASNDRILEMLRAGDTVDRTFEHLSDSELLDLWLAAYRHAFERINY